MPEVSNWISIFDLLPSPCKDVFFTDGHLAYYGWLETYSDEEELSWFNAEAEMFPWVYNITHWKNIEKETENDLE